MSGINAPIDNKALLVLDGERKITGFSSEFMHLFDLGIAPFGVSFDTLFEPKSNIWTPDMRGKLFLCRLRDTGKTVCGRLTGDGQAYRIMFFEEDKNLPEESGFVREEDTRAERLSRLVHHMQEGVATHRLIMQGGRAIDYVVEDFNGSFAELFGLRHDEAAGQLASHVFGTGKAPFLKKCAGAVLSGRRTQFEIYYANSSRHFLISVTPWSRCRFGTVVSDLSESRHSQLLYKALNVAAAAISDAVETDDIFAAAAHILQKNGFECMLLPVEDSAAVSRVYMSFGEPQSLPSPGQEAVRDGFCAQVVRERRSVYIDNLDMPKALPGLGLRKDLKCIAAPLVVGGAMEGILVIMSHALRQRDMEAVTAFANQLAAMMEKAALIGKLWAHISKLEVSKRAHKEVAERLKMASRASRVGIWDIDLIRNVEYMDNALERIYGLEPNSFDGSMASWRRLVHPDDHERVAEAFKETIRGDADYAVEFRIVLGDGTVRYISSRGVLHKDETGKPVRMVGTDWDVTERKQAELALMAEKELLATTLKSIGDGVVVTDAEGRITLVNAQFEGLCGRPREEIHGRLLSEVFCAAGGEDGACCRLADKTLRSGRITTNTCEMLSKDGKKTVFVSYTVAPIRDADGVICGTVLVMHDITEQRRKQQKIDYLVYHDALTGVYNRRYFDQMLRKLDTQANLPLSVISCDVNGLKLTNDAFGHSAGDRLLKRMASILTKASRPQDIVARVGGDEFCILVPGADEARAAQMCENIKALAAKSHSLAIGDSISVGCETKKRPEDNIRTVINQAESHMYRNKTVESPNMRDNTIKTILYTLYKKCPHQRAHADHVSRLCGEIAERMGLCERDIGDMRVIGLMHDIGNIAVDERILNKTGPLTDDELTEIKRHCEIGFRILMATNDMAHIAKVVLAHHERYDGKGYPNGIRGEEIPLMARIVSVADTFDAMTSPRAFRKAQGRAAALREIAKNSGAQFDPAVADAFLRMMNAD